MLQKCKTCSEEMANDQKIVCGKESKPVQLESIVEVTNRKVPK
jgi:hypothetical protein